VQGRKGGIPEDAQDVAGTLGVAGASRGGVVDAAASQEV
jgi:hypothetical protein